MTIFTLWLIASLFTMIFLAKWAYNNYQDYRNSSVLTSKRRVHCTHYIRIYGSV